MKLEVPVTASIASFFDCKLNPKRSHRLVTRYCSTHGYCEMAMDVISIIILFFNQCLYWKVDQRQEKQFDNGLAFGLCNNLYIANPLYSNSEQGELRIYLR
eukprot:1036361_1